MTQKRPLNVCLIIRHFGHGGGLEKYALRITHSFLKMDAKITILTSDALQVAIEDPHLQLHQIKLKHQVGYKRLLEFNKKCEEFLKAHSFDIIFGLDRNRTQTHMRAGNGVHASYMEHRKPFDSLWKRAFSSWNPLNQAILKIEKESFESPNLRALFTNSNMVKEEILNYYRTDPNKIYVIHNGVEWEEYAPHFQQWLKEKNQITQKLQIDPSSFHFLFIGNGYKRKGLNFLLEALSTIKLNDFHLSVVGKEKRLQDFKAYAHRLGLGKKVTFFGPQKNMIPFYQMADCLVIPSLYDPFANVTVEALSMGLFVVSSNNNGGKEVIRSENGLILPDLKDRKVFADYLVHAIDHPKTWSRSEMIRQTVKHLDFPNQLRKLTSICLNTLET